MPPRSITLAIVAFWLAAVGLFAVTDVWPRLRPAEPLMFPVDVVDEAGTQKELVDYVVSKNGAPNYRAVVELHYHPEDDSFESVCTFDRPWANPPPEAPREPGPNWLPQVHKVIMKPIADPPQGGSRYHFTRSGEMKRLEVTTQYRWANADDPKGGMIVRAEVSGTPQSGHFQPHVKLTFPRDDEDGAGTVDQIGPFTARDFERDATPVPVLPRGIVLNPFHPPRRFTDLADGQRWRFTFIDPLGVLGLVAPIDAARGGALREAGLDTSTAAWTLGAHVRPGTERIDWEGGKEVSCRVIDCDGDGPVGPVTYWVRQGDGVVMREDFRLWGDSWSLLRRPAGHGMHPSSVHRKVP